jgi:hypothetical protein
MDDVVDLRAQPRVVPVGRADVGELSRRAGVRRLFELPVEPVSDCTVRIQAGQAGQCAVCGSRYASGEVIGHSRERDGWVASCCT